MCPVNVFFPSADLDVMFREHAYRCIGHVPEPPEITKVLRRNGKAWKLLKKWTTYTALSIIFEPWKALSHEGVNLMDSQGKIKKYYPIPVFYVADLLEYQTIFGISSSIQDEASMPDPGYIIQTINLDEKRNEMPKRRSEKNVLKLLRKAHSLNIVPGKELSQEEDKIVKKMRGMSLDLALLYSPKQSEKIFRDQRLVQYYWGQEDDQKSKGLASFPLAGFNMTNCFDLIVPDKLHTLDSGIGMMIYNVNAKDEKSLFNAFIKKSRKNRSTITDDMSRSIEESSCLLQYSLPTCKFGMPPNQKMKVSSAQAANLRRLALVACLVDESLHPMIPVLKGMLNVYDFIMYRKMRGVYHIY